MSKVLLVVLVLSSLSACVGLPPSVMMVNDKGEHARCAASRPGVVTGPQAVKQCVEDYQKIGYHQVS